jgi:hypothetical protein
MTGIVVRRDRHFYAERIRKAFGKSVAGFIEAGKELIRAKEGPNKLPHGQFTKMVEDDLSFGESTARMLMTIARHPVISNRDHGDVLPASWRTLYEFRRLPDEQLVQLLNAGTIHPALERKEAVALVKKARRTISGRAVDESESEDDTEETSDFITLDAWNNLDREAQRAVLQTVGTAKFNKQDSEFIGWAK